MNWTDVDWKLLVAVLALGLAVLAYLLNRRKYWEDQLKDDAPLRREWALQLRDASTGNLYRTALARALAWLDRVFGEPGSARALGVCVVVAVIYGWVAFFLGWGVFHGSGKLGDVALLKDGVGWTTRGIALLWAIVLPLAAFYCSRWLVRWLITCERRLQARGLRCRRRLRRHRRGFFGAYRGAAAYLV